MTRLLLAEHHDELEAACRDLTVAMQSDDPLTLIHCYRTFEAGVNDHLKTEEEEILVNYAYLAPPYQITAIGPKGLYERLTAVPSFAELVRTRADGFGISIGFAEPEKVVVPAYAGAVTLREARAEPTPTPASPGGSSSPGGP